MHTEPEEQHRWLQRLVGEWSYVAEMAGGPGQPAETFRGTERVRALGDLWIIGEGDGETPGGGTAKSILTLGYNPKTGRFVGTWIGSTMAHMWIYDGALDPDGRTLPLISEGPSMTGDGTQSKYKDQIQIVSDDERTLTGHGLGADGTWQPFMTVRYRRTR